MIWWLKTRQAAFVAVALAVTWIGVWLFADTAAPFPNLRTGGIGAVPLMMFLPLAPVAVVVSSVGRGAGGGEAVAARPIGWLDAALCAAVAVSGWGVVAVWDAPAAAGTARNLTGYLGLALLARVVAGPHVAAAAPAGFAVLVALFAVRPGVGVDAWAWSAAPGFNTLAGVIAVTAGVVGCGVLAAGRHRL